MSAFEEHREELEHYEQMFGRQRGRLAVALDLVTNAMILAGQHTVYCHNAADPRRPMRDVQLLGEELAKAKELIQNVMEDLRGTKTGSH
jgi:hypothetical protein